jgi:hypothetical protein
MRIRLVTRMAFTVLGTTLAACQQGDSDALARAGVLSDAPSIEGHFEMRIASMYDGSEHRSYHVKTGAGTFELTSDDPEQIAAWDALGYQSFVRAYGSAVDPRTFATDELEMLAPPPEPLIDPSPRPHRRIATVLLHWNGAGEYSNEQAKDSMFIAGNSTNVFYGENSYGMEKIAGDVFGSYEIEKPLDCYSDEIKEKGLAAFIDKGHDPGEFYQFMCTSLAASAADGEASACRATSRIPARTAGTTAASSASCVRRRSATTTGSRTRTRTTASTRWAWRRRCPRTASTSSTAIPSIRWAAAVPT